MTNDRYAELRAALDAGPTPGPWRQYQTLVCAGTIGIESSGDDIVLEPTRGISLTDARYIAACHPEAILALLAERDALREAAEAAIAYDAAIEQSANDPAAMYSFCTATGDNLDALYEDWITKARAALTQQEQGK